MPPALTQTTGLLIAFEGLDQSGKQTQAESLRDHLRDQGRKAELLSFPDYSTAIGDEIARALHGGRDYPPDVLQLLYVANRGEKRAQIDAWIAEGVVVICDRYIASSIAYGEAHGLDAAWLTEIQRFLPAPHLTVLLDIAPETAVGRKAAARDRFERDLELLGRVRASYRRQAAAPGWVRLEGERGKAEVTADVIRAVETRLALPSPR
jgi:dTMP kinase